MRRVESCVLILLYYHRPNLNATPLMHWLQAHAGIDGAMTARGQTNPLKSKENGPLSGASDFHGHGWNIVNHRCMLGLKDGSIARYSAADGFSDQWGKKRRTFGESRSTEGLKGIRKKIGGLLTSSTIVVVSPIDPLGGLIGGKAKSRAA